jgi:hypothetical protein
MTVTFEVYNENIRDLLSDVEEYLDLRGSHQRPVAVSITEIENHPVKKSRSLLQSGNAKRSQAATPPTKLSFPRCAAGCRENRDRAPVQWLGHRGG